MSYARPSLMLVAGSLLLGTVAAQAEPSVQLSDVRSALAEGERVGTLRSGADCGTVADRGWSQLMQQRVASELPAVFRDEVSKAGGLLPVDGAPLRAQAVLSKLDYQVCQAGAGTWQGSFAVQVSWQLVASASGQVVYQASTEGAFTQSAAQRLPAAHALREALAAAAHGLVTDQRFAAAFQAADVPRVALAR